MDMYRIHDMLEGVSEAASTELAKGTESVNTKEFGDVVDMIKDLSEAEKNKMEACYYKTLINAMEESEYGEDYDEYGPIERRSYSRGSRGNMGRSNYSSRRNYPMHDDMMYNQRYDEYMNGRMGYSNGAYGGNSRGMSSNSSNNSNNTSRYGYSYDKYMSNRRNYSKTDPEDKQERMKMMEEYSTDLIGSISKVMEDVSPEEKQMLKNNLNKVMSAM